jgi:hypothetical protein
MKFIDPSADFMRFQFLETVYSRFHLDETPYLFLHKLFIMSSQKTVI